MTSKELNINEQIRAREVRVIDDEGQRGVMSLDEALRRARAAGLDLVEVSPKAVPPVCRILLPRRVPAGFHATWREGR